MTQEDQSKNPIIRLFCNGQILICLGYGIIIGLSPIGCAGVPYITQSLGYDWDSVIFCQSLCFLSTAVSYLVISRLATSHTISGNSILRRGALAAAAIGLIVSCIPTQHTHFAAIFGMVIMSCAIAVPQACLFEQILIVYRANGRARCIAVVAGSMFVGAFAAFLLAPVLEGGVLSSSIVAVLLFLAALCLELSLKTEATLQDPPTIKEARPYRITPYTLITLISFGLVWSLEYNVNFDPAFLNGILNQMGTGLFIGVAVSSLAVIISCMKVMIIKRARFGLMVRTVLALSGTAWALVPFLISRSPAASSFALTLVFILQCVIMIVFAADICAEQGLLMMQVGPIHFLIFILASCVGTLLFWLLNPSLGGHASYDALGCIAVIALFAIVPFLPSRSSQASAFTQTALPEDEGFETRVKNNRALLASRYGLTEREETILELLILGKKRNDIADALNLSPWTVKTHVTSIYKKMGVHSTKEVMVIAASGDTPVMR